jgi:hypothetical protein
MTSTSQPTRDLVEDNGRHTTTLRIPAAWNALKYDDEDNPSNRFFKTRVKTATKVSAVDFLLHDADSDALVLIECKDFRGDTVPNLPRLSDQPTEDEKTASALLKKHALKVKIDRSKPFLATEFAKNIRDTLVGLLAAARADDKALAPFYSLVLDHRRLICVLSLEMDPQSGWQPGEGGRLLGLLRSRIERELAFVKNTEVIIWSGLRPMTRSPYSWEILASG